MALRTGRVGKSTVSWQLFTELTATGVRVAFADTDQLCMCYPAPPGDPGRHQIKVRNVGALIANYRAAGIQCVIVNGVVDPAAGVSGELIPHAALMVCRLRADRDAVMRRFAERHEQQDDLEELLQEVRDEVDAMDASTVADVCVDTTGIPAAEVARLVRDSCRDWPGFTASMCEPVPERICLDGTADDAAGQVLLISGPTGVGKSTIGFELYMSYLQAGLTAGYVDLDQIGFVGRALDGDPGGYRLRAANLAAMWQTYHAAGATRLVATGPIQSHAALHTYAEALRAATVRICRLRAGRAELTRRIMSHGRGGSWPQPGDPFRGQPASYLRQVIRQALADGAALERQAVGTPIDTDGRTVTEAAALIAAATEWEAAAGYDIVPRPTVT